MELARPSRKTNGKGVQVEDTQICVVMVGLPARGKSLIAQKGMWFFYYVCRGMVARLADEELARRAASLGMLVAGLSSIGELPRLSQTPCS